MHSTAAAWIEQVTQITTQLGTLDPVVYLNHANDLQKPLCGTGSETLNFLRSVAKEYDPTEVFQRLVPDGHKVSTEC